MQIAKSHILLIPALIAFLVCFAWVAFYNRFASDDFELIYQLNHLGFKGSIIYFYDTWNTRWLAITLMNVIFIATEKSGTLIVFHLLSLLILWFAFYRLTKEFSKQTLLTNIVCSGFMSISFFYSCFSKSDVFFWVNSSAIYLYGTIAFIFALAEVLLKRVNATSFVILIFAGFFLGGSYEPLAFTVMVTSSVFLFVMFQRHGPGVAAQPVVIKTILLLSIVMVAFAVSYAGQGHVIRSSFLPQTTFTFKSWAFIKAVLKMSAIYLPEKLFTALLFAFPWFLTGMVQPFKQISILIVKQASMAFLILLFISLGPVVFIMSEMGPERAWTQISIYLVLYSSILAAYAGSMLHGRYNVQQVTRVYAVTAFLYVLATGVPAGIQAKIYASAYDNRMLDLKNLKRDNDVPNLVVLEKLPPSGWLHSAEISSRPDHFTNQHLKKYLGLNFDVVILEEVVK